MKRCVWLWPGTVCFCVCSCFYLVYRRADGGSRSRCVGQLQREETTPSLMVSVKSILNEKSMAEFCCTLSIVHTARHHATSSTLSLSVHFNSDDDHHTVIIRHIRASTFYTSLYINRLSI